MNNEDKQTWAPKLPPVDRKRLTPIWESRTKDRKALEETRKDRDVKRSIERKLKFGE